MKIYKSLFDKSSKIIKIIDLGLHPPADTFLNSLDRNKSQLILPLTCYLCKKTGGIQLGNITEEKTRYNKYSYSYSSDNSSYSRSYWDKYSLKMIKFLSTYNKCKILEIGSNDGYLSSLFLDKGFEIYGVDPSKEMCKIAESRNVKTFNCLFNYSNSKIIKKKIGSLSFIIANNVFNHSNNPQDFLKGIKNILSNEGIFVFEAPYWYETVKSKKFDQIYHEHIIYLNIKSCYELLKKQNLEIVNIEKTKYHGGSIRIYAKKSLKIIKSILVKKYIKKENDMGLYDINTYKKFANIILIRKLRFIKKISEIRLAGYKVVCVGAAAKGNTLLNYYGLNNSIIDYVTDTSPHKIGKFTPLSNIPIVSDEIFKKFDKVYALILSWNLKPILEPKIKKINKKVKFLKYD